jgi:hypothetical protein
MRDLRVALERVCTVGLLGALPIGLVVAFVLTAARPSGTPAWPQAIDLHTAWIAGSNYLHGRNPYPSSLGDFVAAGPRQSFVQTAPVAALFAPLSLLNYSAVTVLAPVILCVAVALSLRLLNVRDWRCYGAAFLSPAVLTAISIGTLTPLLLLGVAAAWRWRDSWPRAASAVAAVVAGKLFLWPLVLWLWMTDRRRAASMALAAAVLVTLLAWLPIGFSRLHTFVSLLRLDSLEVGPLSYSLASLAPGKTGLAIRALEVGSVLLVVGGVVAARAKFGIDERLVFAGSVVASLLLSPLVHLHYMTLLLPVVAVLRPTFGLVWLAPLALWVTPRQDSGGVQWRTLTVIAVVMAVSAHLSSRPRSVSAS